ncbi:MAG: response regulator transcription factor [Verrucomicrobia bacterium]|nr:response regulator transcription factor [Verrucomicrobiota bacterium]
MDAPTILKRRSGGHCAGEKAVAMTTASNTKVSKRKVLLVDEHRGLRERLREFINAQPDLAVCGVAEYTPQALAEVDVAKPDVVVADVYLKGRMSFDLIKEIKARHPTLPVLVFSMQNELVYGVAAMQAGAEGFVVKTEPPEKVLAAVRRVLSPMRV